MFTEITADALVTLTGQALTMQENTPGVVGDANVSITGFQHQFRNCSRYTDVTTEDLDW